MTATDVPPRAGKATSWITTACFVIVLLFVVITVLTPSLYRSSDTTNKRFKCGSNLKQIGRALLDYARAHGGHFPDTLEQLVLSRPDLSKEVYICPSSNDEAAVGETPADIAASFSKPHRLSYIYFGKGLTTSAKDDTPLMAEPLDNHGGDGVSILFTDGHVDFCQKHYLKQILGDKLDERR